MHRASAAAEIGFFWDTLQVTDPSTLAFYHDAKTHGVGPSGYTLPIVTERGDKIAISVSSSEDREAFRDRIHHVEQDLLTVGFCITEAFARLASEDRPTEFALTDDQMAILRSVAMGAGEEELRAATYLYGSYATLERSICTMFRTQTITQATILAARVGLLTNAPLTKSDILIGSSRVPNRVVTTPNATSMRRLIKMRNVAPGEAETAAAAPDWSQALLLGAAPAGRGRTRPAARPSASVPSAPEKNARCAACEVRNEMLRSHRFTLFRPYFPNIFRNILHATAPRAHGAARTLPSGRRLFDEVPTSR